MRPIWAGSISFGLVNIPVKLYLAARSERMSFRMLHGRDLGPVQFKRFCSLENREVPYGEISRGWEYEKGRYLVIEDEDFDRIEKAAARTVDIQQFVDSEQISPMFFETPYFLEPTRGAERAYVLLREALKRSGKVGIARVVLKEREYLSAVLVQGAALVMSTLRYVADLREPAGLNIPEEKVELPGKQLELALMLVEQLAGDFHPEHFKDDYEERVRQMVREKLEGVPAPERAAPERPAAQVVDLVEVLQRSLSATGRQPPREAAEEVSRGEKRAPRQVAARTAGQHKK